MTERDPFGSDDHFIAYCELHSETERALFHSSHIARLLRLAGEENAAATWDAADRFFSVDLSDVCEKARILAAQHGGSDGAEA